MSAVAVSAVTMSAVGRSRLYGRGLRGGGRGGGRGRPRCEGDAEGSADRDYSGSGPLEGLL